jgi:hypothetical protein
MNSEGADVSLCSYCGQDTLRSDGLCLHHTVATAEDWARANRIMCDFLHRGIVSPRPTALMRRETTIFEWIPSPNSRDDGGEPL